MPPFAANAARFSLLFSTLLFSSPFCVPECVWLPPEGDGARDDDDDVVVVFVVRKLLPSLYYILCRSARVSLSICLLPHLSPLSISIYLAIDASTYPSLCLPFNLPVLPLSHPIRLSTSVCVLINLPSLLSLSNNLSIYLFTSQSALFPLFLSVHLSAYISTGHKNIITDNPTGPYSKDTQGQSCNNMYLEASLSFHVAQLASLGCFWRKVS